MRQRSNRFETKGTTLLEVLVVSFLVAMALVALVSLTFVSLSRNRQAKDVVVQTRLAQEGIEWFKKERLRLGFDGLLAQAELMRGNQYCLKDIESLAPIDVALPVMVGVDNTQCTTNTNYHRWFTVATNASPENVIVITMYVSTKGVDVADDKPVVLQGRIYQWQR